MDDDEDRFGTFGKEGAIREFDLIACDKTGSFDDSIRRVTLHEERIPQAKEPRCRTACRSPPRSPPGSAPRGEGRYREKRPCCSPPSFRIDDWATGPPPPRSAPRASPRSSPGSSRS